MRHAAARKAARIRQRHSTRRRRATT
jgi:hypothetical protein